MPVKPDELKEEANSPGVPKDGQRRKTTTVVEIICEPVTFAFRSRRWWPTPFLQDSLFIKEPAQATDNATDAVGLPQPAQVQLLQRAYFSAPKPSQNLRDGLTVLRDRCVRISALTKPANKTVHMSAEDWEHAPASQRPRMAPMKWE